MLNRGEPARKKPGKRCVTRGAERQLKPDAWLPRAVEIMALHQQTILFEHALCLPCICSGPAESPVCASNACVCACVLESSPREGGLRKVQRHRPRLSVSKAAGFSRERDLLQGGSASRSLSGKKHAGLPCCTERLYEAAARRRCKSTEEPLTCGWWGECHRRSSCCAARFWNGRTGLRRLS